jgi:hypothetical protein
MSSTTPDHFDNWRRTGPLDIAECIALSRFLPVHPLPRSALPELTAMTENSDYAIGVCELRDRGWLRVRRLAWHLTSRCLAELPAITGREIGPELVAELGKYIAAADSMVPPRTTAEDVVLTSGRLALGMARGATAQHQHIGRQIFDGLIEVAEANGFDASSALRSAIRRDDEERAHLLAAQLCDAAPVDELAAVIDRFPAADVLSALAWQRH